MRLDDAVLEFGYAKDHSVASRAWYASRLGAFVLWAKDHGVADVEELTAPLIRRYVDETRSRPSRRGGTLSSHTLHGHVRAIRALLHWAVRDDLLDEKVPRRVALPKREQKVLAVFTPRHIARLLDACAKSETPEYVSRDKALLVVLLDTGLRAGEVCDLTVDRCCFTADDAYVLVNGKGRKQREVPLGKTARRLLHAYVIRQRPRKSACACVFLAKGGAPLTTEGLDRLLYRLRDRSGGEAAFAGVRVSAHTFRHTYAVRALEAGMDIYRLSRLMGHSSVAVTEGYLKAVTSRQARQGSISVVDAL